MENSLRLQTWVLALLALVACMATLTRADSESDLDEAFQVILRQASEADPDEDFHSHIAELDQRGGLARAVQKALDSMKIISKNANFSDLKYRRMDGLGNNLKHPFWGASLHTERRHLANHYDDGKSIPRYMSESGKVLPSAREVSMKCFQPSDEKLDVDLSQMFMQFGQFIDHDIILTELEMGGNCCADMKEDGTHPDMFDGKPCFPIKVGENDRQFKSTNCLRAKRSLGVERNDVREQINGVTSYIDASQVYGSAKSLSDELRTFQGGKMKVTSDNGLPQLGVFKCRKDASMPPSCPHAGDPRVNVFPGLTTMHTTFHREHNRIADKLAAVNSHWDDERLFQEARKIIIAINQKIAYEEYVPKIIGPKWTSYFGLDQDFSYDETLDASVDNVFGAAAFRFGHSQINGPLTITKSEALDLSTIFFRPSRTLEDSFMKQVIIHQGREKAQKTDHFFSPEILDKLFLNVDNPGESFDLPALAVHRSRDHGLPSFPYFMDLAYQFLREKGDHDDLLELAKDFKWPECTNITYDSLLDIDLFVGAMYEAPVEGGLVGPTFAYLIGDQFKRLKDGDRFFYTTKDSKLGFTPDQLKEIEDKTSLAFVLCKSNEKLKSIHPKAMMIRKPGNKKKNCKSGYPDIDFSKWSDN